MLRNKKEPLQFNSLPLNLLAYVDASKTLEDARELDAAISRNGDKHLLPWDQA